MPSRSISSDEPIIDPEDVFLPQCKRFAAIFVRAQRLHGRLLPPAILGRSRCCHRRRNGMVFQHRFVLPKSTAFSSFGRCLKAGGQKGQLCVEVKAHCARIALHTLRIVSSYVQSVLSYKVRPHCMLEKRPGITASMALHTE